MSGIGNEHQIQHLYGSVVEHLSCKQKVLSSILSGGSFFAFLSTPSIVGAKLTGQYEGRTASACPGQAIMTESRSTAAHRKTVAALAILALACQPCGAFPTALARSRHLRRADRRSD